MRKAVWILGVGLLSVRLQSSAATLTVTNASDSGPGSLRQAILDSNASVGVVDTIEFNIPGTPPFVNSLDAGSLVVTDPVVIDGTTQPGYAGLPLFQIRQGLFDGAGLVLAVIPTPKGPGSTVRGLSFADLAEGIRIEGDFNHVGSCFFGTDTTGTLADGNGIGVYILNADDNVISGSLISGNTGYGIRMVNSFRNRVYDNLIGTKTSGEEALGNPVGISVFGGIDNGMGPGDVISGNTVAIEIVETSVTT